VKRLMLPSLVGLILFLAGLVGSAAADRIGGVVSSGSAVFTDPSGDAKGAPDIGTVAISDDAAGMLTIAVAASDLRADTRMNVHLNTDKADGYDYWLHYQRGEKNWLWNLSRWDGSAWQRVPQSSSMSINPGDNGCSWTLSSGDLGGTRGFRFMVDTAVIDPATKKVLAHDLAPDSGTWLYNLTVPSTTTSTTSTTAPTTTQLTPTVASTEVPVIGAPTAIPAKALAGKRLTVSFPVRRRSDGAPLRTGHMICNPTIAGKLLKHVEQYRSGNASVSLTIPRNTKGKLLRIGVTIKLGTEATTRTANFRVH
jgi:hypothetical protein